MTTAANFAQLLGDPVNVPSGSETLRLEQDILDFPTSGEGALLSWNVRREGSSSVRYEVRVNGISLGFYSVSSDGWFAIQRAMPTDTIQRGYNIVEFEVKLGEGPLSISDVILFYRKDIPGLVPSAANFALLCDGPVGLKLDLQIEGGRRTLTLPQDITDALVSGEGALLSWTARCASDPPLSYEVVVNDTSLPLYTVTSSRWAAVQAAIHTGNIRKGSNTVEFRLKSGEGALSISSVMLFYRVNVLPGLTSRVANFAQLRDDALRLQWVGGVRSTLLEQKDLPAPKSGEGALLSWTARCDDETVNYVVRVNDQNVINLNVNTVMPGEWTAIQEAISTDTIKEGDNKVEFEVTYDSVFHDAPSDGELLISDVILWYRQDPFTS